MFQSQSNATRAAQFRTLHNDGSILVLPNAWDAASARLLAQDHELGAIIHALDAGYIRPAPGGDVSVVWPKCEAATAPSATSVRAPCCAAP